MARAFVARAMLAGLAINGEPSLLAGAPCGHVQVDRDVELDPGIGDTAHDNFVVRAHVCNVAATACGVEALLRGSAGVLQSHNPRVGQILDHPSEGRFKLDRLIGDNGHVRRFIVVPVT